MTAWYSVNLHSATAEAICLADAAWTCARQRFLVPEAELLADFLGADNLADAMPDTSCEARRILAAIADFLLANIREDNGWEAPTLDGAIDTLHRCVFGGDGILPHEAARLPMVFAAAFAATGELRFATACDRFAAEAIRHATPTRATGCGLFHLIESLWRGAVDK